SPSRVLSGFQPWRDPSRVLSGTYRPLYRQFFWIFVATVIGLGYLGSQPPEGLYVSVARILTAWYFIHLLIILPLLGFIETPKPLPASITDAVLREGLPIGASGPVPARDKA